MSSFQKSDCWDPSSGPHSILYVPSSKIDCMYCTAAPILVPRTLLLHALLIAMSCSLPIFCFYRVWSFLLIFCSIYPVQYVYVFYSFPFPDPSVSSATYPYSVPILYTYIPLLLFHTLLNPKPLLLHTCCSLPMLSLHIPFLLYTHILQLPYQLLLTHAFSAYSIFCSSLTFCNLHNNTNCPYSAHSVSSTSYPYSAP